LPLRRAEAGAAFEAMQLLLLSRILLITGDFLAMSLTTDNVRPSAKPNAWRIGNLTIAGTVMGACLLAFCAAALAVGKYALGYSTEQVRTLTFLAVVFGSQAMIYAIRERKHLWSSRPSIWLLASSVADILIASILAVAGIAMTPLAPLIVAGTLLPAIILTLILDLVKIPVFARLGIS
jgi:H+-transporting ATPase